MILSSVLELFIIGGLAGWCAGMLSKGSGYGLAGNIIVGIMGSFLGGFCFSLLGIVAYGFIGRFIFAVIGALFFIWLLSFFRK
jgi:uncharacterized membrane protein YeaQ/YmgE (transglycosylase-associated protein family)